MRWKSFAQIVLVAYALALLWLLLFKFAYEIPSILLHFHVRTASFIPFAGYSSSMREMFDNAMVFVPLGLLLSVVFKQLSFGRKLLAMAALSVTVELLQYALAIGVTDVTDVIMNTAGGFVGLALYRFGSKYCTSEKLDRGIAVASAIVLMLFMMLRVFVLRVRY